MAAEKLFRQFMLHGCNPGKIKVISALVRVDAQEDRGDVVAVMLQTDPQFGHLGRAGLCRIHILPANSEYC